MKHILSLSVALLMACVAFAQNITDFYRPGGFDYNGASIKTFSVSDSTAVQFSRGNLQYNPALDKWRFALRQYDFVCGDNANIAEGYDGWIDLFGWGTSGWNSGANAYQPWATSTTVEDYYPGGSGIKNLFGEYANADWGIYNKIENGGKSKGMWRTLTNGEWLYLKGDNAKRSGKWAMATIAGIHKGLLLLPDEWTLPSGCSYTAGAGNRWETNRYSYAEWEKMEAAGAVFMPASGQRYQQTITGANEWGVYWTSTSNTNTPQAYTLEIDQYGASNTTRPVVGGVSVRLVRRVQTPLEGRVWVDMGLPSGTLWYSCNIGTSKPQGYGAYFAWGETKPKSEYEWSNYAYGTSGSTLTKYYSGDGLTELEPSDDVARSSMGGDVRIPTKSEWQELIDSCYGEYTTYKGAKGWMFTSKTNSNRLFLPAAGLRSGTNSPYAGVEGQYWSSSLNEEYPNGAWVLNFNSDNPTVVDLDRNYGFSIRAVKGGTQSQETLAEAFDANGASIKTFTVAEGRTVHFSKGNLWYNAAANLWRFAPEQYEYIGEANSNISETYNEYIDLFGWGTSGWSESGATAYQPWATSATAANYNPGGSSTNNLTGEYANADWGVYNSIIGGGNTAGMWRTLTQEEWYYLLHTRSASTVDTYSNARYAKATVNNVAGLIILPDSFTMPSGVTTFYNVNETAGSYVANEYTTSDWAKLESAGAIFLPAAGQREGTDVTGVGTYGGYWSSTSGGTNVAYGQTFENSNLAEDSMSRAYANSVRLVKD